MKKCLLILGITLQAFNCFALAPPEKCPSVESIIQKSKLIYSSITFDGMSSIDSHSSKFDTEQDWMIAIWVDNAKDTNDAALKAKNALKSMTLVEGPLQIRPNAWSCSYDNDLNYIIRAVHSDGPWFSNSSK
ncbi:hypothetical protein [Legionella spiritensis]|uniref:hypothetical protein n=1 Tax=Legionella spiritensis TaxID=452 RepID=UPI000F6D2C32|nr:hypothetical protein [Legionella spiritensis]VEG90021.1 Uncharacterised protein [Legionella spiritensis]